jgi:phage FluMu gp28-like protein
VALRSEFLKTFLDLKTATNDPQARWEPYQLDFLDDDNQFGIDAKSRQIGWSWTAAARAIADAHLFKRDSIFVSINLEESKEKINYAKAVYDNLYPSVRWPLLADNNLELRFANGARITSHPSRPPRGRARVTVYLDEFAHYGRDRAIYTGALPCTTRGGVIRIGSSPLGASGMFYEIFHEPMQKYPAFKRRSLPWWSIRALCKDPKAAGAASDTLTQAELVERYGTERIINIYQGMLADDFDQEFGVCFTAEATAFITWEEIRQCQASDDERDANHLRYWRANCDGQRASKIDEAMAVIAALQQAMADGKIVGPLYVGMDVGRERDLSEIHILQDVGGRLLTRGLISMARMPYADQEAVVRALLDMASVRMVLIDATGIGNDLAERLGASYGLRCQGMQFTMQSKELWAVETRLRFQNKGLLIPPDRNLAYQIHSIKRMVTPAKNVVFDVDRAEKHHADSLWALALAVWAAKSALPVASELPMQVPYHAQRRSLLG